MNMMADIRSTDGDNMRSTDGDNRKWFRSSRFFQEDGHWFFYTREGSLEGPFELLHYAENRLAEYIKVMDSGFIPTDCSLTVEPLPELELEPK